MVNSREKGARGEREFALELRNRGIDARRGQQFSGSPDSPDVVSAVLGGFHIEVKRTEQLSIYKAMDQAIRDSGGARVPIVAHKRNHKEWLVVMRLDDWLDHIEAEDVFS